ncbi:UPF0488 protein C8orf33 homolog isoform X1 [Megalops cyprinoides]|uniref:UPF0488 protein C8orf33 homolog isoform X1 n=1 Tax=Megalops cyprinoides TaxID=118141 RepID=UPI001864045A|nr:UPF0488 protein C8orf33 homolog isoform X1 [Megalops cyprinoides]XP_036401380.1 UPF0488 protein C8orf33 homolog isoform X1 [Megalops cyprinoides]
MEEAPWGTFQDELDWCIRQLETDLLIGNTNPRKVEETEHVLNVLQSQDTPFVRKRQVMHMVFGDYRQRMTEEHKAQEDTGTLSHRRREETGLSWIPSDNSFTFNFFPDGAPSQTAVQESGEASTVPMTGQDSGFVFNFQIPVENPAETETGLTGATAGSAERVDAGDNASEKSQDSKQGPVPPSSKAKKKKKSSKKKPAAEGAECQLKQPAVSASQGEAASPKGEAKELAKELSSEQQLVRELDWCIEQLELGLRTQKSTPKQMEEASRALKTLRSSKAPLVKKRQVMRAMFGDYRKKMEEDKAKQVKLIQAAVKSARVTAVSEPAKKPVFHRRAECRTQPQPGSQNQGETPGSSSDSFVFIPTQEEFCFNFF